MHIKIKSTKRSVSGFLQEPIEIGKPVILYTTPKKGTGNVVAWMSEVVNHNSVTQIFETKEAVYNYEVQIKAN